MCSILIFRNELLVKLRSVYDLVPEGLLAWVRHMALSCSTNTQLNQAVNTLAPVTSKPPSSCSLSSWLSVFQLQNQSELRAPTAEKAAFFLDAAIASRRSNQHDCDEDDHRNSHMLFTLHIYQYRMEKSGKGGSKSARPSAARTLHLGQP